MVVTERQGAIARDDGSCVLVTDLDAHRTDWRRAVRIILNVQMTNYGRCGVFDDDAEETSSFASIDTSEPYTSVLSHPSQSQRLRVLLPRQFAPCHKIIFYNLPPWLQLALSRCSPARVPPQFPLPPSSPHAQKHQPPPSRAHPA